MPKFEGIYVFNMVGTSGRKCTCPSGNGTWLKHWELATGDDLPDKCIAKGCRGEVEVGAHVKDNDAKLTPWIAPFCQHHNKRSATQLIQLKPTSQLAACGPNDCDQ